MEEYIYFFILILCLFMGFMGLYKPIIGFIGFLIAITMVIPTVSSLSEDPLYMLFNVIVVISTLMCSIVGWGKS